MKTNQWILQIRVSASVILEDGTRINGLPCVQAGLEKAATTDGFRGSYPKCDGRSRSKKETDLSTTQDRPTTVETTKRPLHVEHDDSEERPSKRKKTSKVK